MTTYRRPLVAGLIMSLALAAGTAAGAVAAVGSSVYQGLVQHVSTDNIKVYNPKDKTSLSFLLLPKFNRIFSDDGKTTLQMSRLHAGQYVKVYYDQKALGARHADRIVIMSSSNMKMGTDKE
jgi:hypothetical protein